ncbi:MAG: hypothetical protein ONB12_03600 [candidate division KSB1 bacterium]|nr:hypothetical protein [candidate division KSB1 bacterium]
MITLGILYEKVQLTQELKRQMMIRQLIEMGITEYEGREIGELDYDRLKYILALMRLKN